MDSNPLPTETAYRAALAEIASLMAAEPGTHEGARLEFLVAQVEAYEAEHYPLK